MALGRGGGGGILFSYHSPFLADFECFCFLIHSLTLTRFARSLRPPLLSSWFIRSLSHPFTWSSPHSLATPLHVSKLYRSVISRANSKHLNTSTDHFKVTLNWFHLVNVAAHLIVAASACRLFGVILVIPKMQRRHGQLPDVSSIWWLRCHIVDYMNNVQQHPFGFNQCNFDTTEWCWGDSNILSKCDQLCQRTQNSKPLFNPSHPLHQHLHDRKAF